MILGNYDKIFELATTFRESQTPGAGPAGAITGMIQTTPFPVTPEPGAIINSRLPAISADLAKVENLDPATLVMKVSGFGEVPANFDRRHQKILLAGQPPPAPTHLPGFHPLERHRRQSPRRPRSAGRSKSTAKPPTCRTGSETRDQRPETKTKPNGVSSEPNLALSRIRILSESSVDCDFSLIRF